jgi:hypothetical protein
MKHPLLREQLGTILQGLLGIVLLVIALQLWLLTAAVNAYLGHDDAVLWPAALASFACCALNIVLFRRLHLLERPADTGEKLP